MFERLKLHGAALAHKAAGERRSALVTELREAAPEGVRVSEDGEGVIFEGRALGRRFTVEPRLRWLIAGRGR